MINQLFTNPFDFFIGIIALITAITIHEFSHAFAADKLGDPTPRLMGRLTLNPLAHLDPLGILVLLLIPFGWGKPVQYDPFNLRNPKRDAAIISLAGPTSNLLFALFLSIIVRIILTTSGSMVIYLIFRILLYVISLNVMLAVFNLIPIHPLDGFKIVGGLLPKDQANEWYSLERYGFLMLLLVIIPIGGKSLLMTVLGPIINFILTFLLGQKGIFY